MAKFLTPSKLSENIRVTPEGYLLCLDVPIARTGWQDYGPGETPIEVGDDGKTWIYRDPKEVFNPKTIASFQGKSLTIRHPEEFVDPKNWKELTYGTLQNVRKASYKDEDGEEILLADILITDDMGIGLVKNGLREVSCGYECEYEETGKGEGRQINIVGNHCALVEQGRAGSTYRINDHNGKVDEYMSKLKDLADKLKEMMKTVDEATSLEAKKEKSKDGQSSPIASASNKSDPKPVQVSVSDEEGWDELVGMVDALAEKMGSMGKGKGDDEEEEDEDGAMESRLKALEQCVAKLLEGKAGDEEEESEDEGEEADLSGDEESEESEDEGEEGEEGEKSQKKVGDAALAEILAPGIKASSYPKNLKSAALKRAYATPEGKKVIDSLTGKKKLVLDSRNTHTLFVAAASVLKASRGVGLGKTKDATGLYGEDIGDNRSEIVDAAKMNEINAKHWGLK